MTCRNRGKLFLNKHGLWYESWITRKLFVIKLPTYLLYDVFRLISVLGKIFVLTFVTTLIQHPFKYYKR